MAWISVHDMVIGPKLMGLSKELGCSQNEALGLLVTFWLWGLRNATPDGMILNYEKEDIAKVLIAGLDERYTGKQAVEAMIASGWIDDVCGYLYIHDWQEWQRQWYRAMQIREADNLRKAAQRKRQALAVQETLSANPSPSMPQGDDFNDSTGKTTTNSSPAPVKKPINAYSERFEEFWSVYPRKQGKGNAYKCYNARLKDGWSPAEIMEATQNYANETERQHTEQRYIKLASTFLSSATPFTDYIRKQDKGWEKVTDSGNYDEMFMNFGGGRDEDSGNSRGRR